MHALGAKEISGIYLNSLVGINGLVRYKYNCRYCYCYSINCCSGSIVICMADNQGEKKMNNIVFSWMVIVAFVSYFLGLRRGQYENHRNIY